MKNFIKNKKVLFPKKLYGIRKKCWSKIVHLKKIYIFTLDNFFHGTHSFRYNNNECYQKLKIPFCTKSTRDTKKCLKTKFFIVKRYTNFLLTIFS